MHNLTKIKFFRILLWITYPLSLLFIYPIALLSKKRYSNIFFFFDRYAIGGAQKVHLDILESIKEIPKTVYFTRKSPNDKLKGTFYSIPNSQCHDIHFWCDNLFFRLFSVHYFSFIVNTTPNAKVLGGNSTFFYDMLPFLKRSVCMMELLHNFSYGKRGMEFFGLANHRYLDQRLVIDRITHEKIIEQYKEYGIEQKYFPLVRVIEFGVDIPDFIEKDPPPPLKVLYAGRGTAQKRIWLLNRVAEHFMSKDSGVQFTFAGSMADELSSAVKSRFIVYNEIGDKNEMNKLFRQSHVIILTSAFEGFPVVIKEGMAFGCVPIVTGLPGNKIHLSHMYNSLLMEDTENEDSVVNHAIDYIRLLTDSPVLLKELSGNAFQYAKKNFGKSLFFESYRQLLLR